MQIEHDRPALNGVRCRDASRLLEGLSPVCAWMPSTERFAGASHQPVVGRIVRLDLRPPLLGNPLETESIGVSVVLLVALLAVEGVRERSLALHAVGCPKRHRDLQIVQCRQRRVDVIIDKCAEWPAWVCIWERFPYRDVSVVDVAPCRHGTNCRWIELASLVSR